MSKGLKRMLWSTIIIVTAALMVGSGAFGLFRDAEEIGQNFVTAGTLDLKTDGQDGFCTMLSGALAPGGEVWGQTILSNEGTVSGSTLDFTVDYLEHDGPKPTDPGLQQNMCHEQFASILWVAELNYGGENLLPRVPDYNGDGRISLQELKRAGEEGKLNGLPGIAGLSEKTFFVKFQLCNNTGNEFQGDGVEIIFRFSLNQ